MLLSLGCDKKKDRIYEESSTSRLNVSVENVYEAIDKSHAWVFSYYPGADREYGGFNLFPNFMNTTDLSLQADFTTSTFSSTFRVYPGAGPILTFDTYNPVIHYFGLPGYYTGNSTSLGIGATDTGMKGDFEFLVLSANSDSVMLKGMKYGGIMRMEAVPVAQLSTVITSYRAANNTFNSYRSFTIEVNGKTFGTTTTLARVNGTVRPNRYLPVATTDVKLSFIVTDLGLEFYQDYTVEGVTFNKLTFVAATPQYPKGYFKNTANTLKLIPA